MTIFNLLPRQHTALGPSCRRILRRRYDTGASACEGITSSNVLTPSPGNILTVQHDTGIKCFGACCSLQGILRIVGGLGSGSTLALDLISLDRFVSVARGYGVGDEGVRVPSQDPLRRLVSQTHSLWSIGRRGLCILFPKGMRKKPSHVETPLHPPLHSDASEDRGYPRVPSVLL